MTLRGGFNWQGRIATFSIHFGLCRVYLIGRVSQDLVVTPQDVFNFQGSSSQNLFVTLQGVCNWQSSNT